MVKWFYIQIVFDKYYNNNWFLYVDTLVYLPFLSMLTRSSIENVMTNDVSFLFVQRFMRLKHYSVSIENQSLHAILKGRHEIEHDDEIFFTMEDFKTIQYPY